MLETTVDTDADDGVGGSPRARRRLTLLAISGAGAFDIGLRGGATNAVVAIAVVVVIVVLLSDRRVEQTEAR
jgi:hypothetical protein